jgi:hypothetical protein
MRLLKWVKNMPSHKAAASKAKMCAASVCNKMHQTPVNQQLTQTGTMCIRAQKDMPSLPPKA